jgi:hypothetical protein
MAVQNYGTGGGYQISPGVNVSEIDLTTVVAATSTTIGAFAGVFRWGPVGQRVLVSSENDLVNKFGKPTNSNPETFFTAANFLAYSNALYVSRAVNTATCFSAIANTTTFSANAAHTVLNSDDYATKATAFNAGVAYIAKYPGDLGNSLKVSVCDSANQYSSSINLANVASNTSFADANTSIDFVVGSTTATITLANSATLTGNTPLAYANTVADMFKVGDYVVAGNNSIGKQSIKIKSVSAVTVANTAGTNTGYASFTLTLAQPYKLSTDYSSNTVSRQWEYYGQVSSSPGQSAYVAASGNTSANDTLHVVVADEDGALTGSPGAVLEVFEGVSRATDAKNTDGTTNYYKNVINNTSKYVWFASDRTGAVSNTALNVTSSTNSAPLTLSFQGGVDTTESTVSFADLATAYDLFKIADDVDVSLILTGKSRGGTNGEQLGNYLIDNIAETRKDCVVFVSPEYSDVVNAGSSAADNVVTFRNAIRSTSYGFMDSGYKYQYDKYNDQYRWVPLNGDVAGLCVYTDNTRDPWFSIAGYSRGHIKNIIKLAYNPSHSDRDLLYKNGVNPVITQPGQGALLFGDKTLLATPSAFDRINVRRLFIVLEKAISNAAKSFLFEFNDEFTRAQFVNLVDPFLRDVQGRRGITDFRVVCDTTNNTPEVVDTNRFVGDIYVKPNRSINFIQLNFTAVRNGVEFSEITG